MTGKSCQTPRNKLLMIFPCEVDHIPSHHIGADAGALERVGPAHLPLALSREMVEWSKATNPAFGCNYFP
jgi:hypothetical protein